MGINFCKLACMEEEEENWKKKMKMLSLWFDLTKSSYIILHYR